MLRIQTNVIGTGLLGLLLLPLLEKTADLPAPTSMKPHLTIVASEVHCERYGLHPSLT